MKRLGFFTGKIYDDKDYNCRNYPECCLCLSDERAEDEEYLNKERLKNKIKCSGCNGCPASQEAI